MGNDGVVKITDFGIAWSASSVPLTGTGQVVGTAHYLSPEQAEGGKATPASDVYALGMVAYECLAGRRAFDGENSVQIALKQIREQPDPLPDDVPVPIRAVVERAMAKDPAPTATPTAPRCATRWRPPRRGARPPRSPEVGAHGHVGAGLPSSADAGRPAGSVRRAGRARAGGSGRRRGGGHRPGRRADRGGGTPPAAGSTATTPATSSSAPAEPTTVTVSAADLVGRPLAEVQSVLTGLGLTVEVADVATADVAPGLVTAVGPEGELAPGATVTVTVATAPPPPLRRPSHRWSRRRPRRRRLLILPRRTPANGTRQRARQRPRQRPREREALTSSRLPHVRCAGTC